MDLFYQFANSGLESQKNPEQSRMDHRYVVMDVIPYQHKLRFVNRLRVVICFAMMKGCFVRVGAPQYSIMENQVASGLYVGWPLFSEPGLG